MSQVETTQETLVSSEELAPKRPEGGCLRYGEECENMSAGGTATKNKLCPKCLDNIRANND